MIWGRNFNKRILDVLTYSRYYIFSKKLHRYLHAQIRKNFAVYENSFLTINYISRILLLCFITSKKKTHLIFIMCARSRCLLQDNKTFESIFLIEPLLQSIRNDMIYTLFISCRSSCQSQNYEIISLVGAHLPDFSPRMVFVRISC